METDLSLSSLLLAEEKVAEQLSYTEHRMLWLFRGQVDRKTIIPVRMISKDNRNTFTGCVLKLSKGVLDKGERVKGVLVCVPKWLAGPEKYSQT